ncbi:MAG: TVP38/TMEM64 family protein [Thermodesulfobacteriota bacterium]|nr:TVP38/TMEM64 family protein [Thermodesulfobacteriota bacterium]
MKKKIIILTVVLVAIGAFFYFDLGKFLTLESLKANRDSLMAFYSNHMLVFVGGYIMIYILQTALSLPGAAILTLAGGAIFGVVMGTIYVNIGATTGSVLAFLLSRTLLRDWVVRKFGNRMEAIDNGLQESGLSYLLFLRLVPLFPFFLINLACGITGMSIKTYILGTMIGILPGSLVYANAGASLATINNLGQVASPRVLISFSILGLFALVPTLYKKVKGKNKESEGIVSHV